MLGQSRAAPVKCLLTYLSEGCPPPPQLGVPHLPQHTHHTPRAGSPAPAPRTTSLTCRLPHKLSRGETDLLALHPNLATRRPNQHLLSQKLQEDRFDIHANREKTYSIGSSFVTYIFNTPRSLQCTDVGIVSKDTPDSGME